MLLRKLNKAFSADHCLDPGDYELHIEVTASNAKPIKVAIAIARTDDGNESVQLPPFRAVVR